MCFKKPKLPEKTPEDIELEAELKAARENRKREVSYQLGEQRDAQTNESYARALGFMGNRSLISGGKGGAGFLGAGSGRVVKANPAAASSGGGSTAPAAPSYTYTGGFGGFGGTTGYSGGSGSGGRAYSGIRNVNLA